MTTLSIFLMILPNLDAWISTGGTNAGVMKHVGEAVAKQRHYETAGGQEKKIVVLGIANWCSSKTSNSRLCLINFDENPYYDFICLINNVMLIR
jgi:hypothetical protein